MSNRDVIRIAGDDYPFSVVKEKFLQIDYGHILTIPIMILRITFI